jgi:phosphatidylinositol glycan class O
VHHVSFVTAQLFSVPWSSVICWGFLTTYFFYGTGHNPTFPGIQWEAAFVGTGGQFSNHIVPALLVCLNTFTSHFVLSLLLPVLLVAPFTLHTMFSKILPSGVKDGIKSKDMKRGELILYERDDLLYQGTFIVCAKYILFFGIRVS